MTNLDKIKLIDFYLHGVDRGVVLNEFEEYETSYNEDDVFFETLDYHTSLDALRPVIVKLHGDLDFDVFNDILHHVFYHIEFYLTGQHEFSQVFDSVVECIKYLNEKEK